MFLDFLRFRFVGFECKNSGFRVPTRHYFRLTSSTEGKKVFNLQWAFLANNACVIHLLQIQYVLLKTLHFPFFFLRRDLKIGGYTIPSGIPVQMSLYSVLKGMYILEKKVHTFCNYQIMKLYRHGHPNSEYTIWKIQDFSATQILREINLGHFEAPKTTIYPFEQL